MYPADGNDKLYKLPALPAPVQGGGEPQVMAEGDALVAAYPAVNDGKIETAAVKFLGVRAQVFGPAEGLGSHPFADRGLAGAGAFEVKNSAWAKSAGHTDARHLIIAFDDRTLDVLCGRVGFRFAGEEDPAEALGASLSDGALKWWFLTEPKNPKKRARRPMQRDWLKDEMIPGIQDVVVYEEAEATKPFWKRAADFIAQRQMRRAFGRRRTDL